MAQSFEVLAMLIPNGGYVQRGDDFEGIDFVNCDPITKEQYQAGFKQFDQWKAKQQSDAASAKAALLEKLGITAEEAQLLLGGN